MSADLAQIQGKVDAIKPSSLHADIRLRFEGIYPDEGLQTQRPRFRLRMGFAQQITDELTFGARLASGKTGSITTTNQTIENGFGIKTINIDQAYLQYKPTCWPGFTAWGGKFQPPWVTTPMVWDSDAMVEGIAQNYNYKNFNVYLGELVPTVEGYYLVAQADAKNLFTPGLEAAVTYHFINDRAWRHVRMDMQDGTLMNTLDFSRLAKSSDYRAIEGYGAYSNKISSVPFKVEANYLQNLEKTAPGLRSAAGWQKAAWARLTLWNMPANPGDWNTWGEWGRTQPNSVLSWLTDADRGGGGTEWWAVAWNYRLMHNTDFAVEYFNRKDLKSPGDKTQLVHVDVLTKF
jgi:hypothetical protein